MPVTELLVDEILSLPMYPTLTELQIERIAAVLAQTLTTLDAAAHA